MKEENKKEENQGFMHHRLGRSAFLVIVGIILLFSTAVAVVLIAPRHIDTTWTSPSSLYQVQMYEVQDPNYYISSVATDGRDLQYVNHLKEGFTLLSFKESENLRFVAPKELEQYITSFGDKELKLTSRLLFIRPPEGDMIAVAKNRHQELDEAWKKKNEEGEPEKASLKKKQQPEYHVFELYDPKLKEAFSFDYEGGILQSWVDDHFTILDKKPDVPHHHHYGVIYVPNPREFRISWDKSPHKSKWHYNPKGHSIRDLAELTHPQLGFRSRQEMIAAGEEIYKIEGCWYCHTDQTRTLIEDVVLNGTDAFAAPPSSANEFIYQKVTFPGTRRIGPDVSRTGVKRPSREWHIAHFWAPKVTVEGSIMPAFRHFFEDRPRKTENQMTGTPNDRFEAIYQYMMVKGTRITAPNQAWWLGSDPIQTKKIINGQKKLE